MQEQRNDFFMQCAIELAQENVRLGKGGPFGAVIVNDGVIIAQGANSVTRTYDPTAHAEIVAIRAAAEKLQQFHLLGCVLYTSCEPCPMCLGAIYWAHIDTVYYAATKEDAARADFDDQFIYKQLVVPNAQRLIPFIQLLPAEGKKVFTAWADAEGKIRY